MAQLCLSTCGWTRLSSSDAHCCAAVVTWVATRRSTASRLSRRPVRVGNSGSSGWPARSASQTPDRLGLRGEWDGALLASLALDVDVAAAGVERDVAAVEREQLGDAQAGLEREDQHRAVAAAFPAVLGWRVDQRLGFLRGEEGNFASLVALGGDRQDALDDRGVFGVSDGRVTKQRPDGSEPQVARPGAVAAVVLEVIEERRDHRLVELLPVQRRGCGSRRVLREAQQQPERVAVGGDRARAGVQLPG
jgi:hypothetical protein